MVHDGSGLEVLHSYNLVLLVVGGLLLELVGRLQVAIALFPVGRLPLLGNFRLLVLVWLPLHDSGLSLGQVGATVADLAVVESLPVSVVLIEFNLLFAVLLGHFKYKAILISAVLVICYNHFRQEYIANGHIFIIIPKWCPIHQICRCGQTCCRMR